MSRVTKRNENENMIGVLQNLKKIAQKMQSVNENAQDYERNFLPQMANINRMNAALNNQNIRHENNTVYMKVYNLLLEYYVFSNSGDGISLKSDVLLKEENIAIKIKEAIAGFESFQGLEFVLDNIEDCRESFSKEMKKLKEIKSRNRYVELEEIFDYIGMISFDNECSLTRFIRAINRKIKELNKP